MGRDERDRERADWWTQSLTDDDWWSVSRPTETAPMRDHA